MNRAQAQISFTSINRLLHQHEYILTLSPFELKVFSLARALCSSLGFSHRVVFTKTWVVHLDSITTIVVVAVADMMAAATDKLAEATNKLTEATIIA